MQKRRFLFSPGIRKCQSPSNQKRFIYIMILLGKRRMKLELRKNVWNCLELFKSFRGVHFQLSTQPVSTGFKTWSLASLFFGSNPFLLSSTNHFSKLQDLSHPKKRCFLPKVPLLGGSGSGSGVVPTYSTSIPSGNQPWRPPQNAWVALVQQGIWAGSKWSTFPKLGLQWGFQLILTFGFLHFGHPQNRKKSHHPVSVTLRGRAGTVITWGKQ